MISFYFSTPVGDSLFQRESIENVLSPCLIESLMLNHVELCMLEFEIIPNID